MKIEVYLEMEKAIVRGGTPYRASKNPYAVRRRFGSREDAIFTVKESFSDLSPKEKAMMDAVRDYADAHDVEYRVYDVSKIGAWLRALFRGVKQVPAVVIGKRKFVESVSAEQLKDAMEHT